MPLNVSRVAERRQLSVEQVELLRNSRGMTQQALERVRDRASRRAVRRLDYPDAPRARLAYRLAQSRDEFGRIPAQPLVPALRQLDALRVRVRRGRVAGVPTGRHVRPPTLGITPR